MSEIPEETRLNETTFKLVSYGLVALMMTCGALTLGSLVNRLVPAWQPWVLAGICFFITLDRLFTYQRFVKLNFLSKEWAIALFAQWIVIFFVVKVVLGLSHGINAFLTEIPLWVQDFSVYFLTPEFMLHLAVIVMIWLVSGYFAELLAELGLAHALVAQRFPVFQNDQPLARERLLNLVFSMGAVLIMLTALVRVDLRAVFYQTGDAIIVELPALAGGGASTLAYFMLGLALLSQTQFMELHTRWGLQNIPVSRRLARRWALYSIVFLALLAAFVSILPTSYSLGLLSVLGYGLDFISRFLIFILQVFISILIFLLSLPFLLFGRKSPLENVPLGPLRLPQLPSEALAAEPAIWWELLKSIAFWAIFLGILIFSLIQYLRQHEEVLQALRKLPGWKLLAQILQWLQGLFTGARSGISKAVESGLERLRARRAAARDIFGSGFINLRRLDPRQKVYFYYLALIRRSGETGLPRRPSQTPIEFAAALETALPSADNDIDSLTEAFVEARYTRKAVEPEKANLVRATWERIRKALRGRK